MSVNPAELAALIAEMTAKLDLVLAQGFGAGGIVKDVQFAGAGPHIITNDHYGKQIEVTAGGPAVATLRVPANAPRGALFMAHGLDCRLVIAAEAGASIDNWQNHSGSAAAKAPISLYCRANPAGNNAVWWLNGATTT